MTPTKLSKRILVQRLDYISQMIGEIQSLPLENPMDFFSDRRNLWSAESCLRRALEAILDLGRHILAKCYGKGVTEYKKIADELEKEGVLSRESAKIMKVLAGYRNRMVHFYHEMTQEELYSICSRELEDLVRLKESLLEWVKDHPEKLDDTL